MSQEEQNKEKKSVPAPARKVKSIFAVTEEDRIRISEEHRARMKEYLSKLTAEYQLGEYIGGYIARNYLPTLSIDGETRSNKPVKISENEEKEYNKLREEFSRYGDYGKEPNEDKRKVAWKNYITYRKLLESKYLPEKLLCHVRTIRVNDISQLKLGIMSALWDSDICAYKCEKEEDIVMYDSDSLDYTIIELTYDGDFAI